MVQGVLLGSSLAVLGGFGLLSLWRLRRSQPVLGPMSRTPAYATFGAGLLLWGIGFLAIYLAARPGDTLGRTMAAALGLAMVVLALLFIREAVRALQEEAARMARLRVAE